jgi:hypothetical protein
VRGGELPQVSDGAQLRAALAGDQMARNRQYFDATVGLVRQGLVDVFQLHFYESSNQAAPVASLVRSRVPAAVPVQAWEVGQFWPDAPDDPTVHAEETTKVACALLGTGVAGRNNSELRFGLLDPDGTPRPAGTAFLALRDPSACPKPAT